MSFSHRDSQSTEILAPTETITQKDNNLDSSTYSAKRIDPRLPFSPWRLRGFKNLASIRKIIHNQRVEAERVAKEQQAQQAQEEAFINQWAKVLCQLEISNQIKCDLIVFNNRIVSVNITFLYNIVVRQPTLSALPLTLAQNMLSFEQAIFNKCQYSKSLKSNNDNLQLQLILFPAQESISEYVFIHKLVTVYVQQMEAALKEAEAKAQQEREEAARKAAEAERQAAEAKLIQQQIAPLPAAKVISGSAPVIVRNNLSPSELMESVVGSPNNASDRIFDSYEGISGQNSPQLSPDERSQLITPISSDASASRDVQVVDMTALPPSYAAQRNQPVATDNPPQYSDVSPTSEQKISAASGLLPDANGSPRQGSASEGSGVVGGRTPFINLSWFRSLANGSYLQAAKALMTEKLSADNREKYNKKS